ncbi:vWA domain-containing protein [Tahibacter soli]|uniref:VWA domain-containing protein n=1 Tax=Tahibacter soli TaxID=2983605 RepID=A0A9X4BJH6_9GAMM|nr:VWA domain-containing protein [Tahibacter soli]MDC8013272.1 VWA domain-containing protein [Tahibacter soli]
MRSNRLTLAVATALTLVVAGCAERSEPKRDAVAVLVQGKQQPAPPPADAKAKDQDEQKLESIVVTGSRIRAVDLETAQPVVEVDRRASQTFAPAPMVQAPARGGIALPQNTERYQDHADNPVHRAAEEPVSTFSIDVDTGSYANVRRMLTDGQLPPADAVRAEEFMNYFDYGYAPPATREVPFRVTTEVAPAPWNAQRQLMLVGIKGYEVPKSQIPAANVVFLIDTSGSMDEPNKLPLLRDAFKRMVPNLRAQDRVAIVVYAGSAGLVLEPTPGDRHERIVAALDSLAAGGSTNGGAGIALAYTLAQQSFIKGGVNRVILATDGDFNVGTTDDEALKTLVAEKRKSGIALTTLGFGEGNYNDQLAEQLADVGNGNHAYIDTLAEANKVLGDELSSTMLTIAKDVKIQVEFNPALVAEYRLIGYENRVLRGEDFNNDKIDAGEIGAGHDVTALYEITLVGSGGETSDALRYGAKPSAPAADANELAFVKLRYKQPDADVSKLVAFPVRRDAVAREAGENLRFAAAVAAFADRLRGGSHLGDFDFAAIGRLAGGAQGRDASGYRGEFVRLVDRAASLSATPVAAVQIAEPTARR